MDMRVLSDFIKQLEKHDFKQDSITIVSRTKSLNVDKGFCVGIIDPLTRNELYRFTCDTIEKEPKNDQEPKEAATKIAEDLTEPVVSIESRKPWWYEVRNWWRKLKKHLRASDRSNIPRKKEPIIIYKVIAKQDRKQGDNDYIFELYQDHGKANDVKTEKLHIEDLLPTYVLSNKSRSDEKRSITKKIDGFRGIGILLAIILVAVAVLNNREIVKISEMEGALLGAAILLILLPWTKTLKFLGVEYERFAPEANANQVGGKTDLIENAIKLADVVKTAKQK